MEGNSIIGHIITQSAIARSGAVNPSVAMFQPLKPVDTFISDGDVTDGAMSSGGALSGVSAGTVTGVSAAAKLNEVISVLTIKSALTKASKSASSLSSVFSGANGNLAGSWSNVSEFANTINKRVEELIKRFSDELQAFAAMTEQNEQEITSATNNANDLASNILAELGL